MEDVRGIPVSALAWLGDAQYELFVRRRLMLRRALASGKLHRAAIAYVSAQAQARALEGLLPILTDLELDLVRRAQNQQPHSMPKHTDLQLYRRATAFEALIGYYAYLEETERMLELLEKTCTILEADTDA